MKSNALLGPVLGVLLAVLIGWLLWLGRGLLVPIVSAAIAVYVLGAVTDRLRCVPLLGRLPDLALRLLALLCFATVLVLLGVVVATTVRQLIASAPTYQANFEAVATRIAIASGAEGIPTWVEIRAATMGQINVQSLLTSLLGGVSSTGTTIALVVVYAAFLFGERGRFATKLTAAFDNPEHVARTAETLSTINTLVGEYLTAKTLVNIALGVLSYVILIIFGVNFALFFALVIGLSNYIPYL